MDIWEIYSGVGTDGGFGDYAPPYWDDDPISVDEHVVFFVDEQIAHDVAHRLSERAQDVFYAHGKHDRYDGRFPVEFEARKIVIPDVFTVSSGVQGAPPDDVVRQIIARDQESWMLAEDDDMDTGA